MISAGGTTPPLKLVLTAHRPRTRSNLRFKFSNKDMKSRGR